MFCIDEYYLGVILADPNSYDCSNKKRYWQGCSFDPFSDVPLPLAFTVGMTTLLHKIGDRYYDEYYSIYKNEFFYELNSTNSFGIMLAYARPFKAYYSEEPTIYQQEELESDYRKMEAVFDNHSYYVTHSKITRDYAIVQLDIEPMKLVTMDYIEEQLKGSAYQKKR